MRLLRVQGQDLPGQLAVGNHQRGNGFSAQAPHRFQAVAAVGGPKPALRSRNGNDRIQEQASPVNHIGEAPMMRLGKIALERSRFNPVNRQDCKQQRAAAEGVAIGAHHGSTFFSYTAGGLGQRLWRGLQAAVLRLESARSRRCLPWPPSGRCTLAHCLRLRLPRLGH